MQNCFFSSMQTNIRSSTSKKLWISHEKDISEAGIQVAGTGSQKSLAEEVLSNSGIEEMEILWKICISVKTSD